MSGANNQGPPNRLTPIAGDMPIGRTADGTPIRPSFEFFQCIQRILSYLGQPGQGNSDGQPSSDQTVAEQLDALQNQVAGLSAAPGTAAPGLDGRISLIESLLRRMPWLSPGRPRKPRQIVVIPAAPQKPQFFYPFLPPPPPEPGTDGSVSLVATGTGLTGGPITNSGTVSLAAIGSKDILGNPSAGSAAPIPVAIGSGLTLTAGGTLQATGGAGTVTNVATSGAGISGGPITGSGTLTVEWNGGTVSAISSNLQISGGTLDLANSISLSGSIALGAGNSLVGQNTAISAGMVGQLLTATNGGGTIGDNVFTTLINLTLGRGNWLCWAWVTNISVAGDFLNATIGLVTDGVNNAEQGMQAPTVVNGANIVNPGPLYVPDRGSSQAVQFKIFTTTGGGGNPTVGASTLYALRIS